MKRNYLLLASALLLLTACGNQEKKVDKKETTSQPSSSQVAQSSASETSSSQEAEASSQENSVSTDAKVHYNGSYYSVTGKYGEILVVNKHYPLSPSYNPGEDPTAKAELLRLIAAMQAQGYPISDQYSGFRSYDTQASLYQSYVDKDGKAAADRYSARPGHSEHQTGLAYDLIDTSGNLVVEEKASQWLLKHASDYGFVVRYLSGKEAQTGYMPEQWHLRYVSKEAADIAASGLTLEEYYGFTGGDYVD